MGGGGSALYRKDKPMTGPIQFLDALIMLLKSNRKIEHALADMTKSGQSLILNWGEDDNLWECSWIAGHGVRYTGWDTDLRRSVIDCLVKAKEGIEDVER